MSFLFGWFWSDKAVDAEEESRAAETQRALFQELNQVFETRELAEFAERKYDYEEVHDTLTQILENVEKSYEGAKIVGGHWVFASPDQREACKKYSEKYLDTIVKHKDFIEDNTILKLAIAKKIMSYAEFEEFHFDWHYWQLFRRLLNEDIKNQSVALGMIEHENDSSSSEWDTSEENE